MSITAPAPVVLEPESQAFVEATAKPPFLYELTPAEARKVLDDVQAARADASAASAGWSCRLSSPRCWASSSSRGRAQPVLGESEAPVSWAEGKTWPIDYGVVSRSRRRLTTGVVSRATKVALTVGANSISTSVTTDRR
jgi:hypothetical protein